MSWHLTTDRGRQVWSYDSRSKSRPIPFDHRNANSADKVWRRQAEENFEPLKIDPRQYAKLGIPQLRDELGSASVSACLKAINYFKCCQMEDGHWPGDYGGPMFLMPGAIIVMYVTKQPFSDQHRAEMIKYLFNHQSRDGTGGWGLHIEEKSTMFGTVLSYIACRLLGVAADDPRLADARKFIHQEGGAMFAPSWAKFWLCVLGVMPWSGVNSLFPELWLFPEAMPFHPWRYWCHARMVYMPMSYCFANRVTGEITELVRELRSELYTEPYENIDFTKHRDSISKIDLYTPQTLLLKCLNWITNTYERVYSTSLRERASKFLLSYIDAEDSQTQYIDIGPVNKFVNMLSVWHAYGPSSPQFKKHLDRVVDYLWISEDGMKVQGYNGSQLWDTAFATQAITESGLSHLFEPTMELAHHYLEISQVMEDVPQRVEFYRHISKGGWPFSTRDHGWPITDCTAEGIKATIAIQNRFPQFLASGSRKAKSSPTLIDDDRLKDAINVILSFQNPSGGWATYELQRGGAWLELINPAEVFGGIMVDYPYVECSSASIQSLCAFRAQPRFADHRKAEIDQAIKRGVEFIKSIQRADGSWYGSWAVCFCYGIWFGVEALIAAGESKNSQAITRAVAFLLEKQNADGGWGESYQSCVQKRYVPAQRSQVVNTAWAALVLIKAGANRTAIRRAIQFLLDRQQPNGDWAQEDVSGVFNNSCMISYSNYRNIFPIWAIGRFIQWRKQEEEMPAFGSN